LRDQLFCEKNPALPRITDFSPAVRDAGIRAVVFNHGTAIHNVENTHALAWSSSSSYLDVNGNGSQDEGEPAGPFVVAAEFPLGQGMVKLVADPSLITNTMVNRNDNSKFAALLTSSANPDGSLLLDRTHLNQSPLDVSKISLEKAGAILSHPYAMVGLLAVVFALIACYTLRKGEIFG
jgi:hypothetical protein